MTTIAFFLILSSVILHAAWHFISKSQRPPMAFFLLVSFGGMVTALPFALCSGLHVSALPWYAWLFPFFGGLCGVVTNAGLSFAYRLSDVSLAYPLARALPVLMTALLTTLVTLIFGVGTYLNWIGVAGMIVIFFGCMMMPLRHFSGLHPRNFWRKRAMGWIVLAALGTTGYTILDKFGIDLFLQYGSPRNDLTCSCAYAVVRELLLFTCLFLSVLVIPHERIHLDKTLLLNKLGYLSGIFATSAYVLVLLAYHYVSNASYVQAFRQMSLPLGVFLGVFFLKENLSMPKLTGLILIIAGLSAVAFGK